LENSAEAWGTATVSTGVNEFKACGIWLEQTCYNEAVMSLSKVFTREAPQSSSISAAPVTEYPNSEYHRTEWKERDRKDKTGGKPCFTIFSFVACSNFWGSLTYLTHGEEFL
jgi:hypothetical protein